MLSTRITRRLVQHHVPMFVGLVLVAMLVFALDPARDALHQWSMATGYAGLVALGATLLTGPLNVLRRRPNPVSTDLRRDFGFWAGGLAVTHFVVGLQVHMKHRWLYFLRETGDPVRLLPRADLFGFANYSGLVATLIAALLLMLSSDRALRWLGTQRWKSVQRWNYALFVLVLLHTAAYQVIEKRTPPLVVVFVVVSLPVVLVQATGYRRRRHSSWRGMREPGADGEPAA